MNRWILHSLVHHCFIVSYRPYGKKVLLVDSTASYGHDCNNGRPDLCADNLDPKGTSLDGMARPFLASEPWIRWIKEFDMTEYFTFKQISGFYFVASLTDGLPLIRKVHMSVPFSLVLRTVCLFYDGRSR